MAKIILLKSIMKKLLITILLTSVLGLNAQNINYGIAYGAHVYDAAPKNSLSGGGSYSYLNIGAFLDAQLADSYGVTIKLMYSPNSEDSRYLFRGATFADLGRNTYSSLNFQGHFKYDVNNEYSKGFYLLGGPRVSFILNAENRDSDLAEDGADSTDFYSSPHLAFQAGFGVNFLKHFAFELIGDVGLNNTVDFGNSTSNTVGANFNILINLESLINK